MNSHAKHDKGAALVVTTFVKNCVGFGRLSGEPVNECANGWGYYDLGLQNENFVFKAKELGLDTLIMGIRDGEAIRKFLDIPSENEQAVSVIAVGYGTKDAQMPKRKSVSDITEFY
uniref:nitroreductase family protein n=1 Tax=Lachnospira sp. TaxID=2049031 RepID=UPI00402A1658